MKFLTRSLLYVFVAFVAPWAAWHERKILRNGEPLDHLSLADARLMGVSSPEKIRVLTVEQIPFFNGRFLRALSKFFPAISIHTVGVSLRYGIYLRRFLPAEQVRQLIAHELVHSAQYESCGSIFKFLTKYFSECLEVGYLNSAMESEAEEKSRTLS